MGCCGRKRVLVNPESADLARLRTVSLLTTAMKLKATGEGNEKERTVESIHLADDFEKTRLLSSVTCFRLPPGAELEVPLM